MGSWEEELVISKARDALNPKPRPSADEKEVSKDKTSLLQAPPEPDLEGPEESGRGTRTAGKIPF